MKPLMLISRIFVGMVFVFSGFVKAIDPTGFAIKFEEYFLAFHMDFLVFMAFPLAIAICAAELMIGMNLLLRIRMKFTSWMLLIFMSFFTVLTFILALTNPVTDCGCFGDAVKLTNWQTFGKNIILAFPTLIIFIHRDKYAHISSASREWIIVAINYALPIFLSIYCLLHQPIIDFRPYKIGTNIVEKMTIPMGSATDVYETILVYKQHGIRKEFTETNYPWQDTTWKWVETRQKLISRGYEPPIHDFSITNSKGADITHEVLSDTNDVFLIIAPKVEHASIKAMQLMNEISIKANNGGSRVFCLTSSSSENISDLLQQLRPVFEICTTDETTLKTMIRANPGLILLLKGTIMGKWNFRDAPALNKINKKMLPEVIGISGRKIEVLSVLLLIACAIIFYSFLNRAFLKTRNKRAI